MDEHIIHDEPEEIRTTPDFYSSHIHDTGLSCFIIIAKYHNLSVDSEQLKHVLATGTNLFGTTEILQSAKEYKLKAKAVTLSFDRFLKVRLPVIVSLKDGSFIIVAKNEDTKLLILNPLAQKPIMISHEEFLEQWTGESILFTQRVSLINEDVKFGLKWFIPSIIKYKKLLYEVLVASLSLQILGLLTPIVIQVIIDKALVHRSYTTLDVILFGLIVVVFFETALGIARTYVFTSTTNKMDVILGSRLFRHLFRLPLRYFETRRVGDTIARVREVENIRRFLTGAPLTAVLDIAFMFIYVFVMFFYSVPLTFIVLASLPLFAALSAIVTPMFKTKLDEKFNAGAESQSFLVESVTGIQTIKSFAVEPQMQKKWEQKLANYTKTSFNTEILGGIAGSLGQFIQRIFDLIILWVGARYVMSGDLSVGQLIAFRMLSSRVSTPVLRLVQMWQEFQQIGISIKRLGDIFNAKPEPAVDPTKAKLPAVKGRIVFEHVHFRYRPDAPEVIRDITFDIPQGTILGVVGRSGSGKSTLSKLIQRLYVPEMGKITVDGVDLALVSPSWLRRQIGVVLQENYLFDGSVRDNIAFNDPSAPMEELIKVAELAGAHEFILELPEGYDTRVGERGTSVSGGQRQRIAIARALLTNPRILVFDEATSALDYESETIIQNNLKNICADRTVIIIAHRLSTLKDVNKIMVLDRGMLVEMGTQQELLKQRGLFHYLYSQQGMLTVTPKTKKEK